MKRRYVVLVLALCSLFVVSEVFAQIEGVVLIPEGEALIGSTEEEQIQWYKDCEEADAHCPSGVFSDEFQHTVQLGSYMIDQGEVTVAEYREFVESQSYENEANVTGFSLVWNESVRQFDRVEGADPFHPTGPSSSARDIYPVTNVSWNDAQQYCEWRGGSLPTEAQWERAARGPEALLYPWGNEWEERLSNSSRGDNTSLMMPADAPIYIGVTAEGVFHMLGNVAEWVGDWYDPVYGDETDNPTGPEEGSERVIRGGSIANKMGWTHSSWRSSNVPTYTSNLVGFRCAYVSE